MTPAEAISSPPISRGSITAAPHFVGRHLVPAAPVVARGLEARYTAAFYVFLVLNAVLFVRPQELVPDESIYGLELYQYLMIPCLALGLPAILQLLKLRELEKRPITICVLGSLLAIFLSLAHKFEMTKAAERTVDFSKTVLYYLLFVSLVTTPKRLQQLLNVLLWSTAVVTLVAILCYYEVMKVYTVTTVSEQLQKTLEDKVDVIQRMQGTGIFHDPNDLCILLAMAIPLGLYRLVQERWAALRFAWLAMIGVLFFGVLLTQSRGGLLALLVALGVVFVMRYGARLGTVFALCTLPLVLLAMAGSRQGNISTTTNTATERLNIWSDGLVAMKGSPVFGIGRDEYTSISRLVAHNAYLHALTELGFFGGTFFIGAAFLSMRRIWRCRPEKVTISDPTTRRLVPFVGGSVAACFCGMMTLSLNYVIPTELVFALGEVLPLVAKVDHEIPEDRFDLKLVLLIAGVTVAYIVGLTLFVRMSLRG